MAKGRTTGTAALVLLALGAGMILAGRSIGLARKAAEPNYETGPSWGDVILLALGGAALFVTGAITGLIWVILRLRRKP